ncbi:MAG: transketolase [Bacteroidetes bacterium]|nr:transketolase [Bacteroidota bacterium]
MLSVKKLQDISNQVRRDIIRMTHMAGSGHPGGALGAADFLVTLYYEFMKPDPNGFTMDGTEEDIFFLSNGHVSALWYSVLARYGYFGIKELGTFRRMGSRLQGHPSIIDGLPGIRVASGSLGMGLSVATGAALAKKLNNDNHLVYLMLGDGELEEGQNWEALMFASAWKVDNLIAVIDYNGQQIDGPVEKVMDLGNLRAKLEAFGWHVIEMYGNDIPDILEKMKESIANLHKGKPVIVIMTTHMGFGVKFMLDNHKWHGVPPNDDEAKQALAQLDETLGDF